MGSSTELQSYNLAMITLKERCHLLNQQLQSVNEENIKLKVQLANHDDVRNVPSQNVLLEQVEILANQKAQQSKRIHILATENKNLWSRLSSLTMVNRTLSRRLSKFTGALDSQSLSTTGNESNLDASVLKESDCRREIEDLSLKFINNIKLEKFELESQYEQMVALHSNDTSGTTQDFAFTSTDGDDDSDLGLVRKHAQKLNLLKKGMLEQQAMLVTALEELKALKSKSNPGSVRSSVSRDASTETERMPLETTFDNNELEVNANPIQVSSTDNEQICPLCGSHIPGSTDKFVDHVSSHFDDDIGNSFLHV